MKIYELYEDCSTGMGGPDCRATGKLYMTLDRLVEDMEDRETKYGNEVKVSHKNDEYFGACATIEVQDPKYSYRHWTYYAFEKEVIE